MPEKPWYRNTTVLLLACLVLPPAGIVLLWLRPGMGVLRKLLASVALAAFFLGHLFWFYGLRIELAGSGSVPIFTFSDPQSHYARLEDPARLADASVVEQHHESAEESIEPGNAGGVASSDSEDETAKAADSLSGPSRESSPQASEPPTASDRAYWAEYRGPQRDGRYEQTPINTHWPEGGLPELWRQTVGGGYASVVVANGRIFTIEQRREKEVVAAYDFKTGGELWTNSWQERFEEAMGGPGPRATPTWHQGVVYALGAAGELRALDDAAGEVIWRKNILEENNASNIHWAMSASPLVVDDKVIVQPGGPNGSSIVAYHKASGELVWKVLDDSQGYTSPMEVTLLGKRQILTVTAGRMVGLEISDGSLLWEFPWSVDMVPNISQPIVVDEEHVFLSAGYGKGAALVKISRSGDVFSASEVWQKNTLKCRFNSPVLYDGHVYGLDEGILAAVDVWTGERDWKGGRYGYGQVLLADGHLLILTEEGDVVLVKATPESHQEIVRFEALEGKTWNNPAIADGKLIVRNQTEMVCYDLSAGGS